MLSDSQAPATRLAISMSLVVLCSVRFSGPRRAILGLRLLLPTAVATPVLWSVIFQPVAYLLSATKVFCELGYDAAIAQPCPLLAILARAACGRGGVMCIVLMSLSDSSHNRFPLQV